MITVQSLNETGAIKAVMEDAVERLRTYTKTNACPMAQTVTEHTEDPQNMWLYPLKKWMEQNNLEMKTPGASRKNIPSILDLCAKGENKHKRKIWEWCNNQKINDVTDIIGPNGEMREYMLDTLAAEGRNCLRTYTARWINTNENSRVVLTGKWIRGVWVINSQTQELAQIVEKKKNKIIVHIMKKPRRGKPKPTNQTKIWRCKHCKEIGGKKQGLYQMEATEPLQNRKTNKHTYKRNTKPRKQGQIGDVVAIENREEELTRRGKYANKHIVIVSDGSVRNQIKEGTFAWHVAERNKKNTKNVNIPSNNEKNTYTYSYFGIEGAGREIIPEEESNKLTTKEIHSYRMEAMALLSGLLYLRKKIKWKGTVEWHTDSKSVIDTYKRIWMNQTAAKWSKQRDRDIWETLALEKKKWKNRVTLHHVESHVDKKTNKDGTKRIPTPIEQMNMHADELADKAYRIPDIPNFNPITLTRPQRWGIYKNTKLRAHELTDNLRKQIEEEIQMDTAKKIADRKANETGEEMRWGENTSEIMWSYMRKTRKNKHTTRDQIMHAKIMQGKLATNDYLNKIKICPTTNCTLCAAEKETNGHLICECTHEKQKQARDDMRIKIAQTAAEHASDRRKQELYNMTMTMRKTKNIHEHSNIDGDNIPIKSFENGWKTDPEHRTETQQAQSRMAETLMNAQNPYPIHTGIIYKSDLWVLNWAEIPDSKTIQTLRKMREEIIKGIKKMWENKHTLGTEPRYTNNEQRQHKNTFRIRDTITQTLMHDYFTYMPTQRNPTEENKPQQHELTQPTNTNEPHQNRKRKRQKETNEIKSKVKRHRHSTQGKQKEKRKHTHKHKQNIKRKRNKTQSTNKAPKKREHNSTDNTNHRQHHMSKKHKK